MPPRQYVQQPVQYVYAQNYQQPISQPAVQYITAPHQPVQYQVECVCAVHACKCTNVNETPFLRHLQM